MASDGADGAIGRPLSPHGLHTIDHGHFRHVRDEPAHFAVGQDVEAERPISRRSSRETIRPPFDRRETAQGFLDERGRPFNRSPSPPCWRPA
jgi:hypothetical protein